MLILKGIIVGIGKIIPGVSGSMLAISLGIYEKLIYSINNIFKDFKNNFLFLFKVGVGVLLSITIFSGIILSCLDKNYLITMFLFIGLIIGGLGDIRGSINHVNNKLFIICLIITSIIGIITINNEVNITNSFYKFFYFVFIGIVDAITMVIPGISGTATLMMLGAYDTLINTFSNMLNLSLLCDNLTILIPFAIGVAIGIVFTVKLVGYLLKNYNDSTYSSILGFSASTIILMFFKCINTNYTLFELVLALFMLILGVFISKKINHKTICD